MTYPDGHVGWLVTSHELGRAVLGDNRFSMHPHGRLTTEREWRARNIDGIRQEHEASLSSQHGNFLGMDPPDHPRLRRMVTGEFTVRHMRELSDRIDQTVDDHIDSLESAGPPVDLVTGLALPLPSLMICEMLGVPYERHDSFQRFGEAVEDPDAGPDEITAAYVEFGGLLREVVSRHQTSPDESLIGRLAANGELTEDELYGIGMLLVAAGHHTVKNMLALSVYTLLAERSHWERLTADPDLVPNAVEELLRYLTIFKLGAFSRTATEDIEVGGVTVEEGDSVTVQLSSANRDPTRFTDPDTLDLTRDASGHLAFGHGIHVCLGQHLARLELQAGLGGLARRFPTLRLEVPAADVPMHPDDLGQAGVDELFVTWQS